MTIAPWMNPAVIQRMAGSLLHFFWQGALLAMVAAVALRLLAKRTAGTRYIVSVVALHLMLLAPILTFVFYTETGQLASRVIRFISESLAPSSGVSHNSGTAVWAQWIVLTWSGGVVICAIRLASSWRLSQRLKRSAHAVVPDSITGMFERIREQLLRGKQAALLVSGSIDTPLVVGWLRPMVLLPLSAVTGLSEQQLLAVLAHELAHVRRHDFFVNVLQSCVEAILFYHPAVWWLSARIRTERENCCDDLAVQVCGDRLMYARALIELEQTRAAAPELALAATGSELAMRIRRILGRTTASRDWQSAAAALAFMLVWIITGFWQSSILNASSTNPPELLPAAIVLPSTLSSAAIVGAAQSIAAIVTAQPIPEEPQQLPAAALSGTEGGTRGSIQGTVTKAGTSEVIPNVQITLSPGSVGDSIRALPSLMASRSISMTAPRPDAVVDPRSIQSLVTVAGSQGIALSRESAEAALNSLIGNNPLTAMSDGAGHFTISDVPPGEYIVSARRDGFFGPPVNATSPLLMTPMLATTAVTVIEKKTANVGISMIAGGVISGKIRDAAGAPLSKITVRALALNYQNGYPVVQAAATVKTDDNGDYRLFWLPPGNYYVGADPPVSGNEVGATGGAAVTAKRYYPGVSDLTNALPLTVSNGGETSGILIDIKPEARSLKISGQITNNVPPPPANGGPRRAVSPVFIILKHEVSAPEDIDARYAGVVPASGQFEFKNLQPGSYDLYARIDDNQVLPPYGWGRATINLQNQDIDNIAITVPQSMTIPALPGF